MQQTIFDRENNPYRVVLMRDENYSQATVLAGKLHVGSMRWVLNPNNILLIGDIKIFERPAGPSGCLLLRVFNQRPKSFRQRGLGSAMLEYMISQAEQLGVEQMSGFVSLEDIRNTPYLLDWYQHHGFAVERDASSGQIWIFREM